MMPMHFSYANTNTAGQHLYRTAVGPNIGFNYNQYYPSYCSNANRLAPIPPLMPSSIEQSKNLNISEPKPLMQKSILTNSSSIPMNKSVLEKNDFLTFIEQKAKVTTELNPFANEFSFPKNNNAIVADDSNENRSSYKLIFDDLIEQSLQSIEAIKRVSKVVSVNHVSTQYNQSIDQINRSTQTNNDNDQQNLLEEYSSHTVKLMNILLDKLFLLNNKNDLHNQLKFTHHLCDELHYYLLLMNRIITANQLPINRDNNMEKDNLSQSSPIMFGLGGRMHRLISPSMSYSSTPSFSSRQINPIKIVTSKICLLCQKPVDDSDDVMHKLCRLLSSPLDV